MRISIVFTTLIVALLATSAWGVTEATFENLGDNDTFVTLEMFGDAPGPDWSGPDATGGPGLTGDFLLLSDALNSQNNWATFDLTDEGTFAAAVFSFDFLIDPTETGPSADGFSFSFMDTDFYGETDGLGGAPFAPEEPHADGVLGFAFDTWSNGADGWPDQDIETGTDYQEISVHYNATVVGRIEDTRALEPSLTLDDGNLEAGSGLHTVTGSVNFEGATVSLQVDGNPVFTDLEVEGLAPFQSRIAFAARTGGENAIHAIDNVRVEWGDASILPEPVGCTPANALAGDLDGNGTVEFADFLKLAENFGKMTENYADGDVDCNGTVEFADFLSLAENFGKSLGATAASVPEPSGIALTLLGCGLFCLVRRKRSAG